MAKKAKSTRAEQKVRGKIMLAASKAITAKLSGSEKKNLKKHRDYLRGLENRREELVVANRATNNKHAKELEVLDQQIAEWKLKIEEEANKKKKWTVCNKHVITPFLHPCT
ncbi:hypothetical protein WA588_005636 [Blastocystis sp. NMH]